MVKRFDINIRKISPQDREDVTTLIRTVLEEIGAKGMPGSAYNDPELDDMPKAYSKAGSVYLVALDDGKIVGGGGISQLKGVDGKVCELQKMYFLPEVRGRGVGKRLLLELLAEARKFGYEKVYLETWESLHAARGLYEKVGFTRRKNRLGNTGHFSCHSWYEMSL